MSLGITPRRAWYVFPVVVLLVGGIASALMLKAGIEDVGSGLERVVVPGSGSVTLEEPGTWTVFYEYRSNFGGRSYAGSRDAPPSDILLTSPAGAEHRVLPSVADFNYNLPSASGYSIGHVEIDRPGRYSVIAQTITANEPPVVLAFGREKAQGIVRLVGGIFAAGGTVFLALLAFGLILLFRSRSKRSIELARAGYGMPPPPPAI